jgi:hypothetical protein
MVKLRCIGLTLLSQISQKLEKIKTPKIMLSIDKSTIFDIL